MSMDMGPMTWHDVAMRASELDICVHEYYDCDGSCIARRATRAHSPEFKIRMEKLCPVQDYIQSRDISIKVTNSEDRKKIFP